MRLTSCLGVALLVVVGGCDSSLNSVLGIAGIGSGGGATRLTFTVQPSNASVNTSINPPIQVAAQNLLGSSDTTYTSTITLAIGANPASGSLSGTTTVAAIRGLATFNDVRINNAGTGYTLKATSGFLTSTVSASFNVTP